MVCCGTPLFLKSLYGVGYSLVVTTIASKKGHSFVQDIVKKHVPEATQHEGAEGKMSKEISFQLPFEAAQRFEAMFTEFDAIIKNEEENRIDSYGISVTTMEEVFLKSAPPQHFKGTLIDYMCDQLLIHLDDPDPVIQAAVYDILVVAVGKAGHDVLKLGDFDRSGAGFSGPSG